MSSIKALNRLRRAIDNSSAPFQKDGKRIPLDPVEMLAAAKEFVDSFCNCGFTFFGNTCAVHGCATVWPAGSLQWAMAKANGGKFRRHSESDEWDCKVYHDQVIFVDSLSAVDVTVEDINALDWEVCE